MSKEITTAALELGFFRDVLEASPAPVVVFECHADDYLILYVNPAYEQVTGYTGDAIRAGDARMLWGPDSDPREVRRLRAAIIERQAVQVVLPICCKDGTTLWSELRIAPLAKDDRTPTQYVGTLRDITVERACHEQLQYRALHDALTGLPNRYLLQDRLEHAVARAQSCSCTFVLALLDLNGFKQINDTLGHDAGDELLRQVAGRLTRALRAGDTVARIGGDEFVLLLEPVDESESIPCILGRLIDIVAQPATVMGAEVSVQCSLGISRYPFDGKDGASLMRCADRAMYSEKAREYASQSPHTSARKRSSGPRVMVKG